MIIIMIRTIKLKVIVILKLLTGITKKNVITTVS